MSNIIYKTFYTYQFIDGDLTLYTWEFLEDWGNEVAYTNKATGYVTYVTAYQDPDKFEAENDVFLSRLAAVAHATGEDFAFDIDPGFDEGEEWFKHLREEQDLDEFYQLADEVISDYDDAYKELADGDDEEVEQYYEQTMKKDDEGDK